MINWVTAKYADKDIQHRAYVTTLEHAYSEGRYNIYRMSNGDYTIIFSDQSELLSYVHGNLGSVFLIRFIKKQDTKHSYPISINSKKYVGLTMAQAMVVVKGHEESPRYVGIDGTPYIE